MSQPSSVDELQIRVLGPLAASRDDGGEIELVSRPQRRLVAVLALHVGEVVRAAMLEDWLALSPGALRTAVSRLRQVIGADALETTTLGYRLRAEADVAVFERLVAIAPDVGDEAARATLEEALRLWRGDPLVEFAGEPWAEPALRRLAELRASAVEDLAVLQLAGGEVSAALVAVQDLVDREPFRERSQALLMRALADGGRPTEALRAFQAFRSLLRDEVGIEPSGVLVELDRAIAASVETSSPMGPRPGHPAWTRERRSTPIVAPHHGPPVPHSSFVGRRNDVATVVELIRSRRLVTLTGSGGCGKTRLAIAAAAAGIERLGVAVRWVELGVVPAAADVLEHVAAALGLTPQPSSDPSQQLVGHLAGEREMLLVLDNAEHVLASVTALLTAVLPRCTSLRVLVTSREPLGIAGESVWRVPSLATPPARAAISVADLAAYDAMQLFVERAREARPGFVVDDDVLRDVAAICTGVDGLPLAVELAAARTRTLPVEVVAAGISDAVRWHATASRAPLGRHATLHASIAWSVDLIGPRARVVLFRLAAFQASFALDAALAVGGDGEPPDEVADNVAALVDASLLQFDDTTGRFRMLLTVRRFCTMRAPDELDRARARHAHHLAAFCAEVGAGRRGIERGRFIREMPDLVAAMEWAREHEPRLVFAMCAGLASVRSALGHHSNVADTWTWLLSLDRRGGAASRSSSGPTSEQTGEQTSGWAREWATAVAALMAAATAHWIDVSDVVDEVDHLLPSGAERARGWLARGAAMVPAYQGRLAPIVAHVEEARGRRDDLEDSIYGGFAAYMLALMGRVDEADRHVAELARLTRRHRTSFRVDTVGNGYAAAVVADLSRGHLRAAMARAEQPIPDDPAFSMTAAAALAHAALVAGDRRTLVRAAEWSSQRTIPLLRFLPTFIELVGREFDGERDAAADLAEQYWEQAAPVPVSKVHPLPILTSALIAAGRAATATTMTDEAAALVATMEPAPLLSAGILSSRARIAAHAGAAADAAGYLGALLDVTSVHGFVPLTIEALELAAALTAALTGAPEPAATWRAAADSERQRIGARRLPPGPGTSSATAMRSLPFGEAVAMARDWLRHDAPRPMVPDAQV